MFITIQEIRNNTDDDDEVDGTVYEYREIINFVPPLFHYLSCMIDAFQYRRRHIHSPHIIVVITDFLKLNF